MTTSYYENYYNYLYNDEAPRIRESKARQMDKMTERIHDSFQKIIAEESLTKFIVRK